MIDLAREVQNTLGLVSFQITQGKSNLSLQGSALSLSPLGPLTAQTIQASFEARSLGKGFEEWTVSMSHDQNKSLLLSPAVDPFLHYIPSLAQPGGRTIFPPQRIGEYLKERA